LILILLHQMMHTWYWRHTSSLHEIPHIVFHLSWPPRIYHQVSHYTEGGKIVDPINCHLMETPPCRIFLHLI
jgi:hypothetical protein